MRFSKEKSNELLEEVRLEMVMNPSVTIFGLQDALREKHGRLFDKNYIAKLKNKIHRERANRVNKTIGYEIASYEDTCNELKQPLWEIIDDENSSANDKISAIKAMLAVSNSFLDVMFNAGFMNRQIGVVREEKPLSKEDIALIERALEWVKPRPRDEETRAIEA